MSTKRKLLSIILSIVMVFGTLSFTYAGSLGETVGPDVMKKTVQSLGKAMDGEESFDYLSYIYLGWRTTGGKWQNQVIDTFIPQQLEQAGFTDAGAGTTQLGTKSDNDKSSDITDDFSWVTYYDVGTNTWDPEYAKLAVISAPDVDGNDQLIDRINVESAAFDPTSDTYLDYYNEKYGGIESVDDMWNWIIQKDKKGNRINVLNGEEAKLNQRVHLAWNTCFTDPKGTNPEDAQGVTGEAVYIGTISGSGSDLSCTKYPTAEESNANLAGKVLLSDTSLGTTFAFAQQVKAVAVMSTNSLSNYNLPKDAGGTIIAPYDKSARYANGGSLAATIAQTAKGSPIVAWQFSTDQKLALKDLLLASGDEPVIIKSVSIGDTYKMNDATKGGKGQAVAIAEIKGATKPDERVIICAHVQEPSSNDNATGAGSMLALATRLKMMIDQGLIERPERTITFLWGDEMNLATYWLNSHPEEKANLVVALDMDMVGEDTEKTGGVMRIEKTPDPSAVYNYTLDELSWENNPYYDDTFMNEDGDFVRLPDSHTLWGAGSISNLFDDGFYLNDLYMDATQDVIKYHDKKFAVEVCPYEGGSDHTKFLEQNIPALLTWHFTDYTYHTSTDTLTMSSASEMENVNITTASTALMIASATDTNEVVAKQILKNTYEAALARFDVEQQNTDNHVVYTVENNKDFAAELELEREVLNAWGIWYQEALASVATSLLENPSAEYQALEAKYTQGLDVRLQEALAYAEESLAK